MVFCPASNPVAFNNSTAWSSLIIYTKLRLIKIWYTLWKTKKASYLFQIRIDYEVRLQQGLQVQLCRLRELDQQKRRQLY